MRKCQEETQGEWACLDEVISNAKQGEFPMNTEMQGNWKYVQLRNSVSSW